ncbi:MAG: hypothetical protein JL50_19080 [Peptococcaceae bacterium BICA1-7]|nr:MAG: hypothetical protein JL50_19080 [Peptococcaceae bacterium BICA1-7]HBV98956.1 TetR/AcrR family transcriptional regulator [Desulfotomaculum sp.]
MLKNRLERKKEETKKKIITVAMDLFKKQGFDSTTMDQIAEEADIAKGTIYLHFPVKEAIISEYVRAYLNEGATRIIGAMFELPDTRSRLIYFYAKSREFGEKHLTIDLNKRYMLYQLQIIGEAVRDWSLRSGLSGILAQIFELGQQKGEIRNDIPAQVLAEQLQSSNFLTFLVWMTDPDQFPLAERVELNIDLFLQGTALECTSKK